MSEHPTSTPKQGSSRCPFSGKSFNPFASAELGPVYPLLAQARHEQPVFFSEALQSWMVTRYEDCYAVLQDTRHFTSRMQGMIRSALHPEARALLDAGGYRGAPLISEDGPEHARSRHIVAKLFDKETIAAMEPRIRSISEELVDGFIREGTVDLVSHFTHPLPLRVILSWLGLPVENLGQYKLWATHLIQMVSSFPMTLEEQKVCVSGVIEMQHHVAGLIAERVSHPREDGLTVLAQRLTEEASLDEQDLAAFVMMLITAGHETTSSLLGLALRLLMERPELWERLRTEPHLIERVVEEVLRNEAPVMVVMRMTREEVELGGVKLPAGARLFLLLPSGNRDETRFPEPDSFDPNRPNTRQHLSFGKGAHVCVGAGLARLEARVALEVLTQRLRGARLVEAPQGLPGAVRHFDRLVLAWDVVKEQQAA